MKSIVYVGPFDGVEIGDTGQWAARGETVEVDSDLADRLLEQSGNWQPAGGTGRLEDRTKTELLERASELGIEGRHALTKDELVAAIRDAQ